MSTFESTVSRVRDLADLLDVDTACTHLPDGRAVLEVLRTGQVMLDRVDTGIGWALTGPTYLRFDNLKSAQLAAVHWFAVLVLDQAQKDKENA